MEVILKEDVTKLGSRGDVVKVAEGYGRNFLLPRKLAIEATSGNKKVVEQMRAAAVRRSAKEKIQAEELSKQFGSGYLKSPKVTVGVVEFRPFYILGEVEKPGAYPYTGGLNALSAIAIAGGATYRASRERILIQHPTDSGLREYTLNASIPILPGDIIQVPRRYF